MELLQSCTKSSIYLMEFIKDIFHCGLMTPYSDEDLGRHWLRSDGVYSEHNHTNITNINTWYAMTPSHYLGQCWQIINLFCGDLHETNFSRNKFQSVRWDKKTVFLKLLHLPGANEFGFFLSNSNSMWLSFCSHPNFNRLITTFCRVGRQHNCSVTRKIL